MLTMVVSEGETEEVIISSYAFLHFLNSALFLLRLSRIQPCVDMATVTNLPYFLCAKKDKLLDDCP